MTHSAANDNVPAALLWTPKQTAAALGITTKTLLAPVQAGALPYVPAGRGTVRPRMGFIPADVAEFVKLRRTRNCPSTNPKTARSTSMTSSSAGSGFTALRAARVGATHAQ